MEPSSRPVNPPRPRDPTTVSAAPADSATRTAPGRPWTTFCLHRNVGVLVAVSGQRFGEQPGSASVMRRAGSDPRVAGRCGSATGRRGRRRRLPVQGGMGEGEVDGQARRVRAVDTDHDLAGGRAGSSSAGWSLSRTTTTGQAAWAAVCTPTDPTSSPVNPPRPRWPTTTRAASWEASISAAAGAHTGRSVLTSRAGAAAGGPARPRRTGCCSAAC